MPHIDTSTVRLHYEESGVSAGPAVIFAPGLGGQGGYWAGQLAAFADRFHCITFDHRGVGRSAESPPPYSIAMLADDVVVLMNALGIPRAHFVGHSTGGAMGQWLAVHRPDRFDRFVLSATWGWADARFRRLMAARQQTLNRIGPEAYVDSSLPLLYPRDWFDGPEADLARRAADMVAGQPSPDILSARIDALLTSDQRAGLEDVRADVLVTCAADDCLCPPAYSEDLVARLPNARLVRFRDGGHHFPQTRSDWFNKAVGDFLSPGPASDKAPASLGVET